MPQLCFSTAARLAAKLLFYIESSSFLCILSYNATTPLDDVGRNVAKIVRHSMPAGRSRCADYALGFVLVGKTVDFCDLLQCQQYHVRIHPHQVVLAPPDGVPDWFRRLCFTPPRVIYNHAGGTLITTNRMFDIK